MAISAIDGSILPRYDVEDQEDELNYIEQLYRAINFNCTNGYFKEVLLTHNFHLQTTSDYCFKTKNSAGNKIIV